MVKTINISIHAPTWGATAWQSDCKPMSDFNPRTHVGCDLIREAIKIRSGDFNPRTHVGCDLSIFTTVPYISNFNPRTHVGYDNHCCRALAARSISIHAPTWGATGSKYGSPQGVGISIHAPTWGATEANANTALVSQFQSTHPRGVRQRNSYEKNQQFIYFNPRTHVGCDTACRFRSFLHPNFNPRTHVGCDSQRPQRTTRGTISIHAPTWGAT